MGSKHHMPPRGLWSTPEMGAFGFCVIRSRILREQAGSAHKEPGKKKFYMSVHPQVCAACKQAYDDRTSGVRACPLTHTRPAYPGMLPRH